IPQAAGDATSAGASEAAASTGVGTAQTAIEARLDTDARLDASQNAGAATPARICRGHPVGQYPCHAGAAAAARTAKRVLECSAVKKQNRAARLGHARL